MRDHPDIIKNLEDIEFEIIKGSWGPDEKFDAKLVKQLFEKSNIQTDFTIGEFLKVWRKHE